MTNLKIHEPEESAADHPDTLVLGAVVSIIDAFGRAPEQPVTDALFAYCNDASRARAAARLFGYDGKDDLGSFIAMKLRQGKFATEAVTTHTLRPYMPAIGAFVGVVSAYFFLFLTTSGR